MKYTHTHMHNMEMTATIGSPAVKPTATLVLVPPVVPVLALWPLVVCGALFALGNAVGSAVGTPLGCTGRSTALATQKEPRVEKILAREARW